MVSVFSFALLDSNNCDSKWLFTKLTGYQYIVLWKGACRPDDDPNTRQWAPVLSYQQLFPQQKLTLIKCRALPQIMRCQQILPQCSSLSKLWSGLGQGPAKISQYGGSGPSRNISIRKTQGPLNLSFIHDYFLDKAVRFDVSTINICCSMRPSVQPAMTCDFPFQWKGFDQGKHKILFCILFQKICFNRCCYVAAPVQTGHETFLWNWTGFPPSTFIRSFFPTWNWIGRSSRAWTGSLGLAWSRNSLSTCNGSFLQTWNGRSTSSSSTLPSSSFSSLSLLIHLLQFWLSAFPVFPWNPSLRFSWFRSPSVCLLFCHTFSEFLSPNSFSYLVGWRFWLCRK